MMASTYGPAYVEERDGERISSQRHRIYALLSEQQLHHTIIGGECVEKQCGHKQGGEEQGQQQLF